MFHVALSSVLNLPIYSFYSDTKARYTPHLLNAKIYPRKGRAGFVSSAIIFYSCFDLSYCSLLCCQTKTC